MYRRYVSSLQGVDTETNLNVTEEKNNVPSSVLLKWQREQDEMKQKLVLHDSKEVKELMEALDQNVPTDSDDSDDEVIDAMTRKFFIAGVDISFVKGDDVNACAALVVLNIPRLQVVYEDYRMIELRAPYIPGYLGFREVPFICELFDKLRQTMPQYVPQVIMVDGNGIIHPKEFGSACHLGVSLDTACIGVAKKLFHTDGLEKNEDHLKRIEGLTEGGDTFPLQGDSGKILGMALRSCNSTKNPIYISQGHKISLDTAVKLAHKCCRHRIPEPVRLADINSREYLRNNFKPPDPPDRSA